MNSKILTVEIETEVFYNEHLEPTSADILTNGVPLCCHGFIKEAALDVFEERVKLGKISFNQEDER